MYTQTQRVLTQNHLSKFGIFCHVSLPEEIHVPCHQKPFLKTWKILEANCKATSTHGWLVIWAPVIARWKDSVFQAPQRSQSTTANHHSSSRFNILSELSDISPKYVQLLFPIDWFKGTFTGKPMIFGKIDGFRLRFPLNQSMDCSNISPVLPTYFDSTKGASVYTRKMWMFDLWHRCLHHHYSKKTTTNGIYVWYLWYLRCKYQSMVCIYIIYILYYILYIYDSVWFLIILYDSISHLWISIDIYGWSHTQCGRPFKTNPLPQAAQALGALPYDMVRFLPSLLRSLWQSASDAIWRFKQSWLNKMY